MKNLTDVKFIPSNQTKIIEQMKIVVITVLATVIPISIIFISLKLYNNTSLDFLMRDPAAITNSPAYMGLFSNIGILLWCFCAAFCLFSYAILRQNSRYRESSQFLLSSGLFTSFLMIDDFFLLHEDGYGLPLLGIPEKLIYVFYVILTFLFLFKASKFIKKTEFVIFIAALVFLGLSVITDALLESYYIAKFEDIFKMAGMSCWLIYYTRLCLREVGSMVNLSSTNESF
jgi:hypothetical protein